MLWLKNLRKIIFVLIFSLSGIASSEVQPANALRKLLTPITTLKAQFQQTVFSENNKVLQKYSGNLEFKKPNLFRWQVEKPDQTLVVTDGKKLWNYDSDLEQVTVQDFKVSNEVSPISFLFDDVEKLNTDFTIIRIDQKSNPCFQQAKTCFKLTPKKENASFVSVELGFDGDQIKVMRLLDNMGQTSVFEFKKVINNSKIANSHFNFVPPAGVDVIGDL